jgi:glucose/arabinose dehydrogenase
LEFGPDGRLYVAQVDGGLEAYTLTRSGPNAYAVSATEHIGLIAQIPNHDDDGTPDPGVTGRQVTGLLATGSATNPVLYVSSADPRGSFGGNAPTTDTNSGMVSRLTWTGTAWQQQDLVRGLPRSREDHGPNGLALDPATNTLYLAQGGHTNAGAPSRDFSYLREYAYSAAILAIDLSAIGAGPYDLPTLLDDRHPALSGPFGGDAGRHQAKVVPGSPVRIYAPGFRNPYDVVITRAGKLFAIDNGADAGFGGPPLGAGPGGTCTNAVNEGGTHKADSVHLVSGPGYYGGHPNPTRGNTANTFNRNLPQSPVPAANPIECDPRGPGHNGSLTTLPGSSNGFAEYTASNFGGRLRGDLVAANFYGNLYRIHLTATGDGVVKVTTLVANLGLAPLDVATQGDGGAFPGTVWVADFVKGTISVFEPSDYTGP